MTVRYRLLSSLRVGGAGRPRDFPGGRPRLAGQVSTPDGVSAARGGVRRVLSFRWRWAPVQDSRGPGIRSPVRSDYRCPRKPGSLTMWGMSIGTSATAGPPVGGGTLGQDATTVYALVAARGRAPGCYARPRNWPPAARHCWTGWACGPGRLMGSYVWGDGGTAPVSDARAGTADRGVADLEHRGPDRTAAWVSQDGRMALGHVRLSSSFVFLARLPAVGQAGGDDFLETADGSQREAVSDRDRMAHPLPVGARG